MSRHLPIALLLALLAGCGGNSGGGPSPKASQQVIERGKYLARAADCAGCHTAAQGQFAGGVALHTPFGTIYGTNITPDKEHGIGSWSADDFYRALHDGKAPGRRLYPAMPYTSYRSLTREDSDALYGYLMSVKPVKAPNLQNDMSFPFNIRFGMAFWNMLFLDDQLPDASKGQSISWQRGRYVANALGHCAECHTPRGKLGQMKGGEPLGGNVLGRVGAPALTPAALAARGWDTQGLSAFLATGVAPQGSAFDEMHVVVRLSTQYLTPEDMKAMTTYLLGDLPLAPARLPAAPAISAALASGQKTYIALCAGCHGREGEGKPNVSVAMLGNSTVRDQDPRNLIVATLDGIAEQRFPNHGAMQSMPGFAHKLNDKEMSDLVNYMRATWGGWPASITQENVRALR